LHALIRGFALIGLLLCASPAWAAIALVTATTGQGTISSAMTTTGATLLVACITSGNSGVTLSDSKGNTWTRDLGPLAINDSTSVWRSVSPTVGTAHTVSIATNGTSHDTILVAAFSGISGATLERSNGQIQSSVSSGATISSGSTATTIVADQLVIGCSQLSNNAAFAWTATGGATLAASLGNGNTDSTGALSYLVISSTGVQAATFTANAAGNAATFVATYKAGVVDTQAPTVPAGCIVTATGSFSTTVSCSPSTDNVGVTGYPLKRCSGAACTPATIIVTPSTPTYNDTALTAGTIYRYAMAATDGPNTSADGAVVQATTQALTECNVAWTNGVGGTAPTAVSLLRCDTTASSCVPATELVSLAAGTTTYKDTVCPQPVACFTVQECASGSCSAAATFTCVSAPAQTTPVLSVSPPTLTFNATVNGSNPASRVLTVTNGTASTMNWTVGDDQAWVNESPSSGTNTTPVTVSVSIAGLTAGTYQANITVTAPGATNSPIVVPVTLNLSPAVTPTSGRSGRVR
jgi:hypothetical protein